jgi:hypothetical protein
MCLLLPIAHTQSYAYGNVGARLGFKRARLDSGLRRSELHGSGEI